MRPKTKEERELLNALMEAISYIEYVGKDDNNEDYTPTAKPLIEKGLAAIRKYRPKFFSGVAFLTVLLFKIF
jgi:hypothetical protein